MKKIILITSLLLIVLSAAKAQDVFKKYGHNKEMLTLSKGKYQEVFKNEEIVQIGTVLINTKTNKIVQLLDVDTTKTNYNAELSSRFLTVDPLAEEYYSYSPYAYVMNNPVIYIDPTGEFVTRPAAWLYSIFNGGGEIHRDAGGEYFVSQKAEYSGEEGGAAVSRTFDWKGRNTGKDLAFEAAKEAFITDMNFQQLCEQHGMEYVRYDNRSDAIAGMLQPASMVVLPNPIMRTANTAINSTIKVGTSSKFQVNSLKEFKTLVTQLSKPGAKISPQELKEIKDLAQKFGASVRVDMTGVKGTGVAPHAHIEGLGKSIESRHIWLQ